MHKTSSPTHNPISTAARWGCSQWPEGQAAGSTLAMLRSITHTLRGRPTPMAVTANSGQPLFDPDGFVNDAGIDQQLGIMTRRVVMFAQMKAAYAAAVPPAALSAIGPRRCRYRSLEFHAHPGRDPAIGETLEAQ